MNPHEFLRHVPRTNCGDCGEATCLAFAVAVTKGGADPHRCPSLDTTGLPEGVGKEPSSDQAGLDRVARGQQERDMALVAHLKTKIADLDFAVVAQALGATWTSEAVDTLVFEYLGQGIVLTRQGLVGDGAALVDPRDQILLYNYVASGGGRPPTGRWIGMESLPNSISKVRTLAAYCENPLASRFAGRPDRLQYLVQQLDAQAGPSDQSATVGVIIPVLPRVPVYLLFWDEDQEEGFGARVKVLFDEYVLDFLDIESLVFASERLAERLIELDRT